MKLLSFILGLLALAALYTVYPTASKYLAIGILLVLAGNVLRKNMG